MTYEIWSIMVEQAKAIIREYKKAPTTQASYADLVMKMVAMGIVIRQVDLVSKMPAPYCAMDIIPMIRKEKRVEVAHYIIPADNTME